ncbi:nucleotidyltransferase domain-containing protein, partial [candidate division WWE3 bacterium]|nr:nucleotidyltransferase domain-containing protein [candidate division WWE3 bacterium]
MNKDVFTANRIEGRELLQRSIVESFKDLHPYAIHLFGSGPDGFKDELSDIDIWVTFKDKDIKTALKRLSTTFKKIAPVLVRHHSKSWSPIGGSANSIIHSTAQGLFVVDYYVSKLSETTIKTGSKALYGADSLKRGEWKLNRHVNEKIHDSHTIRKDINLLIDLIFISFKGIVRKWDDKAFIST